MSRARSILALRLAILLLIPAGVAAMSPQRVEGGPSLCPVRHIFHRPCPGCGMSRAISAACHGQFTRAWSYNHMVMLVLPLLIWVWARTLARTLLALRQPFAISRV